MTWIQRYRIRQFMRTSLWILPLIGMVAAYASLDGILLIDRRLGWESRLDPSATIALFATLAGAMLTFIVFLSSTLLLVLQLASAQLSPRVIGIAHGDRITRGAMTLFAFTFTLALVILVRIKGPVPPITARAAGYCALLSIAAFLYLIDHLGRALRPSGALRAVGRLGDKIIKSVYPRALTTEPSAPRSNLDAIAGEPTRTVYSPKDGVLLAFDLEGIVKLAEKAGCVVVMVPEVGDFVSAESPLFRIFGKSEGPSDHALCSSAALGQERTMEQDPSFAFRILVDIASKGLSPAINDPTTAVLAIDQLHHLLRNVGNRYLDEGVVHDNSGALRFVYPTPNWEDFVSLAVTEIRQFGGTSIQIARRLRAMLENLAAILPEERSVLLRNELKLLQRYAGRNFEDPEDKALAEISDVKGMGGKQQTGKSSPPER
jgi:uncharacterized membrane protein